MRIIYYTFSATLDEPLPLGKTLYLRATPDQKRGSWVSRGQVDELLAQNKKLRAKLKKAREMYYEAKTNG